MQAKYKCNRCGEELDEIRFVEPDRDNWDRQLKQRPPLCKSCWDKADRAEAEKHHERGDRE